MLKHPSILSWHYTIHKRLSAYSETNTSVYITILSSPILPFIYQRIVGFKARLTQLPMNTYERARHM